MSKKIKKVLLYLLCLSILYGGIYILLSVNGKYMPVITGKVRYGHGLGIFDVRMWQPKYIIFAKQYGFSQKAKYSYNLLGFLYFPLVYLDQNYIHKTQSNIPEC